MKVVISNGFNRFHMVTAASQAAKRDILSLFITGAYPSHSVVSALKLAKLANSQKAQRLLSRAEDIPPEKVKSLWLSEAIHAAPIKPRALRQFLKTRAMQHYAEAAATLLPKAAKAGAEIYHYRAGYGGRSVRLAKQLGMIALCDHSIVHPAFVASLTQNEGRMTAPARRHNLAPLERQILGDLEGADHYLLNSDFVADTFLKFGYLNADLSVIYQGVDDGFTKMLLPRVRDIAGPLRLLAPAFNMRKGAPSLVRALSDLRSLDWKLTIAGSIDAEVQSSFSGFLRDPRVRCAGLLQRSELAHLLSQHEVVIFPSYAEGSARVIFEALAAGAYIITSPNAGSVVQDGFHGRLVPPWDSGALRRAVEEAMVLRAQLFDIGTASKSFVRNQYSETNYGYALAALYNELLSKRKPGLTKRLKQVGLGRIL